MSASPQASKTHQNSQRTSEVKYIPCQSAAASQQYWQRRDEPLTTKMLMTQTLIDVLQQEKLCDLMMMTDVWTDSYKDLLCEPTVLLVYWLHTWPITQTNNNCSRVTGRVFFHGDGNRAAYTQSADADRPTLLPQYMNKVYCTVSSSSVQWQHNQYLMTFISASSSTEWWIFRNGSANTTAVDNIIHGKENGFDLCKSQANITADCGLHGRTPTANVNGWGQWFVRLLGV